MQSFSLNRSNCLKWALSGIVLFVLGSAPTVAVGAQRATIREAVVEDFKDIVTSVDFGFTDFSGNTGDLSKNGQPYCQSALACEGASCVQRVNWDFSIDADREAFCGRFYSFSGLTDTQATFDGQTIETVSFPEHSLDLDQIDGLLAEPDGARRHLRLRVALTYRGLQTLTLRVELKDVQGGGRFARFRLSPSSQQRTITWNFRDPQKYRVIGGRDLDIHQAKVLSFVIEREHAADRVNNPTRGSLDIRRIAFVPNRPEVEPRSDVALLDLLERRAFEYFLDWSSRKPTSFGIPQDRSTFGDLLTVGGIGFALPAYIIGAERGWISRSDARNRVLSVLRLLADPSAFGPEPIGRSGHRGWFYHFWAQNGRRKLNFDFPASPLNEALNTVEVSTIDTGLALLGALSAQTYFMSGEPEEVEILELAQAIYDRVDWPFMLEPSSQQFYLSWKPNEQREGPPYGIADAAGEGAYSGIPGQPATLNFYTDEAFIVTALAAGSTTHPVPAAVHCAWRRVRDDTGLVRSFPGSLFTYQFLHAFLDTRTLNLPACPGEEPVDWYENSRQAIWTVIDYVGLNPRGFLTYGPDAWGISADEEPDDRYRANGVPPVALNPSPEEGGTVTYYSMISAVSFGADLRARAIRALRKAWRRGHFHLRFGLPDAFHDEISQAGLSIEPGTDNRLLRQHGPWVQRALFAIDQGPMLLHLENARSGLVWNLLAQNPNIQRALDRLRTETEPPPPDEILLEGEGGSGDGPVMQRSNASQQRTVYLHAGESRQLAFQLPGAASYRLSVRYSNDNFGPLETVEVKVDGVTVDQFMAQDTGDHGFGWNVFEVSEPVGPIGLLSGAHTVTLTVSGGDGFGVEIDVVRLERVSGS